MTADTQDIITALAAIVGAEWVKTDNEDLHNYGEDWTRQYTPAPVAIVLPKTPEQVQELVRLANALNFSIVPSGGRTGLS